MGVLRTGRQYFMDWGLLQLCVDSMGGGGGEWIRISFLQFLDLESYEYSF